MFQPKYPTAPTPTGHAGPLVVTPTAVQPHHGTAPACSCQHTAPDPASVPAPVAPRSGVQLTPGSLAVVVAGGAAAVLVVGAVLVSLLLAVAITAASLAVCALVIRSLLNNQHKY